MPHLTADITLGNLAIVVTLIGIAISIGQKLGVLSTTVSQHAATLTEHNARMNGYEQRLTHMVGEVQRIVGRIEAAQDRIDRQTGHRRGEGGG